MHALYTPYPAGAIIAPIYIFFFYCTACRDVAFQHAGGATILVLSASLLYRYGIPAELICTAMPRQLPQGCCHFLLLDVVYRCLPHLLSCYHSGGSPPLVFFAAIRGVGTHGTHFFVLPCFSVLHMSTRTEQYYSVLFSRFHVATKESCLDASLGHNAHV